MIAAEEFSFSRVLGMDLDLNILAGGQVENVPKTSRLVQRQDAVETVGRDESVGDKSVKDKPVQAMEKISLASLKRECPPHPRPLWDQLAKQHVGTKMHVMMTVIEIGRSAIQADEFVKLR